MSELISQTDFAVLPKHLAVIMDGNGRWAKGQGKSTSAGHRAGVEAVHKVLGLCRDYGIDNLTLFAFSSENWQRPKAEVSALMRLLSSYLKREVQQLHQDGVRVRFIGNRQRFSKSLLKQMEYAEQLTRDNACNLVLAVDYGGQWDIADAARRLAERVQAGELQPADIDEQRFNQTIALNDLPDVDLCIRTSGEQRISNFMLWQMAYAELYFSDTLWPDFNESDMRAALGSYNQRQRRFGGREEENNKSSAVLESEGLKIAGLNVAG